MDWGRWKERIIYYILYYIYNIYICIHMSFQLWLTLSISWPATLKSSQPSQPSEASRTSADEASLRRESYERKPWSQVGSNKYEHVKIYEIYSLFMLVWLATVGVRSYIWYIFKFQPWYFLFLNGRIQPCSRQKICSGDYGSYVKMQTAKSKMFELLTPTLKTDAQDKWLS